MAKTERSNAFPAFRSEARADGGGVGYLRHVRPRPRGCWPPCLMTRLLLGDVRKRSISVMA